METQNTTQSPKRENKYIYLWVIQQFYTSAYDWEDACEYPKKDYTFSQVKQDAKNYREMGYPTRIINRRELNPKYLHINPELLKYMSEGQTETRCHTEGANNLVLYVQTTQKLSNEINNIILDAATQCQKQQLNTSEALNQVMIDKLRLFYQFTIMSYHYEFKEFPQEGLEIMIDFIAYYIPQFIEQYENLV